MERRLAAILAADVVGFSRLMEQDEAGTLVALKSLRSGLVDPAIERHHGRIVKLMGDGALVEFSSVVHAVDCAVEIQQALAEAGDSPIRFRIGINIGDIAIDGADIFGNGVNLAARLEALAPAGGVAVSAIVHESLGQRSEVTFADAGLHEVKNISRPIQVWTWSPDQAVAEAPAASPQPGPARKFTLAVVGLENLSGDQRTTQLATGLSHDITVELGRFSQFEVTSGNASDPGPDPDVDYTLRGGIQAAGDRVRVTIQVSHTATGRQIWSQRYDGDLGDPFAFQDETVRRICSNLYHPLMRHATAHARARPESAGGGHVYDLYLRTFAAIELPTEAGIGEARDLCARIVEADPDFALVYEHLAWVALHSAHNAWVDDPWTELREGRRHAVRGISLDSREAYMRSALGIIESRLGNAERGIREARTGVDLNPYDAEHVTFLGAALGYAGRLDEALEAFDRANSLSPGYPPIGLFRGEALFVSKRGDEGIEGLEQFLLAVPEYNYGWALLAASAHEAGDRRTARQAVDAIMSQNSRMTLAYLQRLLAGAVPGVPERVTDAARAAGLPAEGPSS